MDDIYDLIADWPVQNAAVGVTSRSGNIAVGGDTRWTTRIASVAKLLVGWSALVAIEEKSVSLGEPAGPEGATVEHLLAHTSGLAFDTHQQLARPGQKRIYSNTGIELFADHVAERTGMEYEEYLRLGVIEPLGLESTRLNGSPSHHIWSSVDDLLAFAREVMTPRLVAPESVEEATRIHFPDLGGVVPGVGSFDPNPWGLTFEVRGAKQPHWTGRRNSPRTVGHFGGAGTFLWIDPEAGLAVVALTDREFGDWALDAWPRLSDEILARFR